MEIVHSTLQISTGLPHLLICMYSNKVINIKKMMFTVTFLSAFISAMICVTTDSSADEVGSVNKTHILYFCSFIILMVV